MCDYAGKHSLIYCYNCFALLYHLVCSCKKELENQVSLGELEEKGEVREAKDLSHRDKNSFGDKHDRN